MRDPRRVFAKDFFGEIIFQLPSVKDTKRYFRAQGVLPSLLSKACKEGLMVLGLFWEKDPNYDFSIPCISYNEITGETIEHSSIIEGAKLFFGGRDPVKMSRAIEGEKIINGFLTKKVKNNFNNVELPNRATIFSENKKEVFKLNMTTGDMIWRYDSCTSAAIDIFEKEISVSTVHNLSSGIAHCANGEKSSAYNHRWVFVEDWVENWEEQRREE